MRLETISLAEFKRLTGLSHKEVRQLAYTDELLLIETPNRGKEVKRYFVPVAQVIDHIKPINVRDCDELLTSLKEMLK
jgi:hypothetical protein